jgi:dTDP-4-dehydrorhamnose reductase
VTIGRVIVTGAAGQLGSVMVRTFADQDVIGLGRADLDITDPVAVRHAIGEAKPHVVINCAAYNDVDGAEDAPTTALAVNAFAVRSLARAAEECGAAFVHFGTDFVFSGESTSPHRETDEPGPRSTYGASKLLGEWFGLGAPRGYVLRVESLFGSDAAWRGRRGTLDSLVAGLEEGREVRVFTDRVVSPSYIEDVAAATRHLITTSAPPGLYHCVNSGHASWYEVTAEAARLLGVIPRLKPITTADVTMRAARPRYCALDNSKLAAAGFVMPAWQDAVRRWLRMSRYIHG